MNKYHLLVGVIGTGICLSIPFFQLGSYFGYGLVAQTMIVPGVIGVTGLSAMSCSSEEGNQK